MRGEKEISHLRSSSDTGEGYRFIELSPQFKLDCNKLKRFIEEVIQYRERVKRDARITNEVLHSEFRV